MKKNSISIYAAVISVVFALSLFYFVYNIFNEYKTGSSRAQKTFDTILYLVDKEDIQNQQTKDKIQYSDFATLSIEKNGESVIAYPSESDFSSEPNKFIKNFEISVYKNNDRYDIHSSIYVLRPWTIFNSAKMTFIIIAVCTVLTILLIFFVNRQDNDYEENQDESETFSSNSPKIVPIFSENSSIKEIISNSSENTNDNLHEESKGFENKDFSSNIEDNSANEFINTEDIKENDDKIDFSINENQKDEIENKTVENESNSSFETETSEIKSDSTSNTEFLENESDSFPEPLITEKEMEAINSISLDDFNSNENDKDNNNTETDFTNISEENSESSKNIASSIEANDLDMSPVTEVHWEKDMEKRLEKELVEAGSQEQDLSLFFIQIEGYSFTESITKEIVDTLKNVFETKDCIYEYKNDGFAVIKKELSIDDAETLADSVHANITNIISQSNKKCYIGISARTTRVLSASRLILEAQQALSHAKEDPESPIIGFHVDIEKYQEYIKNL